MIKNRRSFIIGIKSTKLASKEVLFIKKYKPWGIILFSRNIKSIKQTKELTDSIKKIYNDENFPILVDQEGGRVSRLENLITSSSFTANFFGTIYKKDFKNLNNYLDIYIDQISYLLRKLGINLNTSPVLDLKIKNASSIIGDRSFSNDVNVVSKLGDLVIKKFHKNKIGSMIKHIPGHGLAKSDSHNFTPVVKKDLKNLNKYDFQAFRKKKSLFAMTAHIIYNKIDPINTATHSKKIIKIIRNKILYKNIIISDDISMKALKFTTAINTEKAFKAGCNLVLHCNARMSEMTIVAKNSPKVDSFLLKKTLEFYKLVAI